jgi:pseudaminic acid cytidylyltransferase
MRIAVIPARGGSKRIPRKNIRKFCGRPMIAWSISAALEAGIFDRVIVSTDDVEIADVAKVEGAEVPFMRPPDLADDMTATVPVIAHALTQMEGVSTLCCLYATAPFVDAADLVKGARLLEDGEADYVMPVASYAFPIQRAVKINDDGRVQMFSPEFGQTRSQDLVEAYHDAGQFYFGRAEAWRAGKAIIGPDAQPLILPRHRVQDIDTPEDWARAELMFKALRDG